MPHALRSSATMRAQGTLKVHYSLNDEACNTICTSHLNAFCVVFYRRSRCAMPLTRRGVSVRVNFRELSTVLAASSPLLANPRAGRREGFGVRREGKEGS